MASEGIAVPSDFSEEQMAQLESLGIRRGRYLLEPVGRIQKVVANRLTEAARDIPAFPLTIDMVIDSLLAQRVAFNKSSAAQVSVNDLMIKAVALALKEEPGREFELHAVRPGAPPACRRRGGSGD